MSKFTYCRVLQFVVKRRKHLLVYRDAIWSNIHQCCHMDSLYFHSVLFDFFVCFFYTFFSSNKWIDALLYVFFPVLRKFMHYNAFIFYSQLKFRQLMHYCLYIFFFPVISEIINTLLFIHLFSSNKLVNSRIVICSSLFLQ